MVPWRERYTSHPVTSQSLSGLAFGHWSATPRGGGQNATPKRWSQGGRRVEDMRRMMQCMSKMGGNITGFLDGFFQDLTCIYDRISIHNIDPSCYSRFGVAGFEDHSHRFFHSMEPFLIVTLICVKSVFFSTKILWYSPLSQSLPNCLPKKRGGCKKLGMKRASCRAKSRLQ